MKIHILFPRAEVGQDFFEFVGSLIQSLSARFSDFILTADDRTRLDNDDIYSIHDHFREPLSQSDLVIWLNPKISIRCYAAALSRLQSGKPLLLALPISDWKYCQEMHQVVERWGFPVTSHPDVIFSFHYVTTDGIVDVVDEWVRTRRKTYQWSPGFHPQPTVVQGVFDLPP